MRDKAFLGGSWDLNKYNDNYLNWAGVKSNYRYNCLIYNRTFKCDCEIASSHVPTACQKGLDSKGDLSLGLFLHEPSHSEGLGFRGLGFQAFALIHEVDRQ